MVGIHKENFLEQKKTRHAYCIGMLVFIKRLLCKLGIYGRLEEISTKKLKPNIPVIFFVQFSDMYILLHPRRENRRTPGRRFMGKALIAE